MPNSPPEIEPLPESLRLTLPAWRADLDVPDLAPGVVRRLRSTPTVEPPPRNWAHVGWATLAAGLLIASSFVPNAFRQGVDQDAESAIVEAQPISAPSGTNLQPLDGSETTVVRVETPPEDTDENIREPRAFPADRLTLRENLLPKDLFSADRLAGAWAALPDPNRTWRDEVRDGVQPFRDGAQTVATLFAEALPPARRPY
ncbi:hypothetical protein [Alienimonas chondri]|uniref:Uncharacterized protein n=1 Tax=Alienimonas chondri TaxID=2681879 RepID=A0ABX1V9N3_9PLAN|nr:hypothetical protein [Alienimonas chondri]NNJ24002.1 hypothetical protein [Alienimonas chondri]